MCGGIFGMAGGKNYCIGTSRFIESQCRPIPDDFQLAVNTCLARGLTPVIVACSGAVVAVAGLGDALRPDAIQALQTLRQNGWDLGILSGDHPDIVARVARDVGIEP